MAASLVMQSSGVGPMWVYSHTKMSICLIFSCGDPL